MRVCFPSRWGNVSARGLRNSPSVNRMEMIKLLLRALVYITPSASLHAAFFSSFLNFFGVIQRVEGGGREKTTFFIFCSVDKSWISFDLIFFFNLLRGELMTVDTFYVLIFRALQKLYNLKDANCGSFYCVSGELESELVVAQFILPTDW